MSSAVTPPPLPFFTLFPPSALLCSVHTHTRIPQIVQDEELRNMLMDPALQRVLQECNDPKKFQTHMRDPVTGE
jgi:hypothetical protein